MPKKPSFKLFMFGIYADWDTLNAKYNKIVKKWTTSIIVIIFYVFLNIYYGELYTDDLETYPINIH